MSVQPGDYIYLYNFNTRVICGPYKAISTVADSAMNH
jgi:hypothetical protein